MTSGNAAPRATAQGNLAKTPFAHLLVYLEQHALTGTLVLWVDARDRSRQERIFFERGRPTSARFQAQVASMQEGLLPFFALERAPYAFYEADLVQHAAEVTRGAVDSLALIAESLRRDARDDVVDAVLSQLGHTPLRLRPHAPISRLSLAADERRLVDVLRADPSEPAQLLTQAGLPERKARRLIYLLAITRMVDSYRPSRPDTAAPTSGTSSTSQPAVARVSIPAGGSGAPTRGPSMPPFQTSSRPSLRSSQRPRVLETPPKPADLSPEDAAFWDEILERYAAMDDHTYFQMLGIDESVGAAEARQAYLKRVKRWHPDRLPPALEPLRPHVETIFGHISEAHACLSEDEKRIEYLKTVREGGGTPAADRKLAQILDAAMEFQKVEVLARRHAYGEALELLERALRLNPEEPDYHAMHAHLLERMHEGPDAPLQAMLDTTQRALALNPDHERAHYARAVILKRADRHDEALEHFRRVAELNPRHVEANREVRIADMRERRRREEEAGSTSGLLGKLFKRKP